MSGGRSSREKGMRAERQIVELFRQVGLEAYRVALPRVRDVADQGLAD
jgi:hypothetical protein